MQFPSFVRFNILVGLTLSTFSTACQNSKSKTFEQGNSVTTYSNSQMISKEMESFLSGDQYEEAVDELGTLTPLEYFEQTFADLSVGSIVIETETLDVSEDDISALNERYTDLNLAYGSMAEMWKDNNVDPYALGSDDYKEAISVMLDAISGDYSESEEDASEALSLKGPFAEPIAAVKMCKIALRCKDNPGQAAKEFVNIDNWKLIAEHQKTANTLVGAAVRVGKFQKAPHMDVAHNAAKTMIACAPAVVGVANAFNGLVQDTGDTDCQASF